MADTHVTMTHPEVADSRVTVSRRAFDRCWAKRGWIVVDEPTTPTAAPPPAEPKTAGDPTPPTTPPAPADTKRGTNPKGDA